MKYKPSDIQSPREANTMPHTPNDQAFTNSFGSAENEMLTQRILFESQGWGEWVEVPERILGAVYNEFASSLNPDEALRMSRSLLGKMVGGGILNRNKRGDGYSLTEAAIERFHERYPAQRKPI